MILTAYKHQFSHDRNRPPFEAEIWEWWESLTPVNVPSKRKVEKEFTIHIHEDGWYPHLPYLRKGECGCRAFLYHGEFSPYVEGLSTWWKIATKMCEQHADQLQEIIARSEC